MKILLVLLAAVGSLLSAAASANPAADFYKGKTITLINAAEAGGGIDIYSRIVAPFLAAEIPGRPNIIVQNMPGAGGLVAANYLYTVAPKDGTVIEMTQGNVPFTPLLGEPRAKFDATKFEWLGSFDTGSYLCISWHTNSVKKFEDLFSSDLLVGATGPTSLFSSEALLLNNLFGTRLSVVSGYKGGSDIFLAMERGEVGGRCGVTLGTLKSEKPDWLKSKKINILVQLSRTPSRAPELAHVPTIYSFARDAKQMAILDFILEDQQMTKPIFAPPGIPQDRAAVLRAAFDAAVSNPQLKTQVEERDETMNYVSGSTALKLVGEAYTSPSTVIEAAIKATQPP